MKPEIDKLLMEVCRFSIIAPGKQKKTESKWGRWAVQRAELEQYILETYPATADYLWAKYPSYEVFRHGGTRKWFALIMDVPKAKLGLPEEGILTVVDVKCDPITMGGLLTEPGFFPAYHMSKDGWITIALDGSVGEEEIKTLVDMSFDLTNRKVKGRKSLPDG